MVKLLFGFIGAALVASVASVIMTECIIKDVKLIKKEFNCKREKETK